MGGGQRASAEQDVAGEVLDVGAQYRVAADRERRGEQMSGLD